MDLGIFAILMLVTIIVAVMFGIPVTFALGGFSLLFALIFLGQDFVGLFPMTTFGMMMAYPFGRSVIHFYGGHVRTRRDCR